MAEKIVQIGEIAVFVPAAYGQTIVQAYDQKVITQNSGLAVETEPKASQKKPGQRLEDKV